MHVLQSKWPILSIFLVNDASFVKFGKSPLLKIGNYSCTKLWFITVQLGGLSLINQHQLEISQF